jgi:hypothetical protein
LLSIAFKLQESKVGMVNNASAAIIRQMIISLFEWVDVDRQSIEIQESGFEFSHVQDALLILSDITCCLDEQKCNALDLSKVDKPFALDLIESVLVNHGQVIRCHREFCSIIQDRICPYLIDNLKASSEGKGVEFAKTCRHWRIIQLLITDFNDLFPDEVEIFLAFGIRILRDSSSTWECAMVLEVSKTIFQSQDLIESIYMICEKKESPRIFKDLLEVMTVVINRVLDSQPVDNQGQITDAMGKSSVLTQFDKSSPPTVSPIALLLLSFDSFVGWFLNISTLFKATCSEKNSLGLLRYKFVKNVNLNPKTLAILVDLVSFIGIPVCRVFERIFVNICCILPSNHPSQLHGNTLEFFSRAIIIFSVMEFRVQLSDVMDLLVRLSLIGNPSEMKRNNLEVIQMVLETGHNVGELLEDSLLSIVRIIQAVEQIQSHKTRMQQARGIAPPVIGVSNDDVLAKNVDLSISFIESTVVWSDESLNFLVLAYSQYIEGVLNASSSGIDDINSNALLLALDKLKRLSCLNMTRYVEKEICSNSWELVMNEFEKSMRLNEASIRRFSMESFSTIVDLFVKSVPPNRMKGSQSEHSALSIDSLQMRIIVPMHKISQAIQWIDVNKALLDCLIEYMRVFGESMKETSWSLVWSMLDAELGLVMKTESVVEGGSSIVASVIPSAEQSAVMSIYQRVHESVKIACCDFLASIPIQSVSSLINLIAKVGEVNLSDELNIPLNSVRYLWDISDFLCGGDKGVSVSFELWKQLLMHLTRLGLDLRPELRNSAVQTLLRTVSLNGTKLRGHWRCIFDEILFEFMSKLRQTAAQSRVTMSDSEKPSNDAQESSKIIPLGFTHFSRDTESKQWDETECTVMIGVSSLILSRFKGDEGFRIDFPELPEYWRRFLSLLKDYALLRSGSVEICSVSIDCLYRFGCGLKDLHNAESRSEFAMDLWKIWIAVGASMRASIPFFTQECLLKYLKMFTNLLGDCRCDDDWLRESLNVLTGALMCPTPSDQVRDFDSATEVQKYLVNQVLKEDLLGMAVGKVLIVQEVSNWLNLMPSSVSHRLDQKTDQNQISMGYASSTRSRQSTSASSIASNDSPENQVNTGYSYVAMTKSVLEVVPEMISRWRNCSELYEGEALVKLIESINRFVKLKYRCPINNAMNPLWRTGTSTLISCLKGIFESDRSDLSQLWPTIIKELGLALHSCKEMFNRALKIEMIEDDERFDCQILDLIVDNVVPRSSLASSEGVSEGAIEIIIKVARIIKFASEGGEVNDFLFPSGVKGVPVSVKEILSLAAYGSLFKLARESVLKDYVLRRISQLLQMHLEAFQADRQILGNRYPFPRLRDLELHVLLDGLITLKATDQLRALYGLVVRCADFGAGGCEGAQMIFKDCRRVLLLLSDKTYEDMDLEDDKDDVNDAEEEKLFVSMVVGNEMLNYANSKSSASSTKAPSPKPPTVPTSPLTAKLMSPSRRSVSEEFFDHLSHDLRIMQLESATVTTSTTLNNKASNDSD